MGRASVAERLADTEIAVALIAEEGPRESIAAILQEQGWRLAIYDDAAELLAQDDRHERGLIALWVRDASASAAQQVQALRSDVEHALVVVICPEIERWEVRAVLGAGATGVVLEEEMAGALGPCLQAVRVGQVCVPRRHGRQVAPPALSMREKQILGLVVMGYMNSQIAEQLFLAESTVKSHLSSAFGKLGVRSRNEAVNLILDSERGFGMGILALGGDPIEAASSEAGSG
ncbi:MAG TPA: response regulator transcription factor [Solirubrobacteraceae bacterium]|jgi:DNA-binding NarL/FixJ family response regulator|nr:response regulator transcription factor [Solirubrobacteraceae bacterium]